MPVRRTPDGKIIEEKTQLQRPAKPGSEGPTTMDPARGRSPASQPTGGSRFDAETKVVLPGQGNGPGAASAPPDDALSASGTRPTQAAADASPEETVNRTRLVGFGTTQQNPSDETPFHAQGLLDGPVTGWLVVVKGPGQGRFAAIGLGRNPVGRSPDARVSLNFGDDTISRDSHVVISYDHRGRRYYLQPGEGQNLSYLNDQPVLNTIEIEDRALIALGDTEVRFVAFCGEDFDWATSE